MMYIILMHDKRFSRPIFYGTIVKRIYFDKFVKVGRKIKIKAKLLVDVDKMIYKKQWFLGTVCGIKEKIVNGKWTAAYVDIER